MSLISGNDVSYMTDTLAQVGSWVEQTVTVFSFESADYSGTAAEAGEPAGVTFGTRSTTARINNVDMKTVERASGRYQANDKQISLRGSIAADDHIVHSTGTFRLVDGPWKTHLGSNLLWQGVYREVKS